jgi:hypothetical protein
MSCCGAKRTALIDTRDRRPPRGHTVVADPAVTGARTNGGEPRPGDVPLRYLGVGAFSTRSVVTGRSYGFFGTGAELPVAPQDVAMLIRTRQFVRL